MSSYGFAYGAGAGAPFDDLPPPMPTHRNYDYYDRVHEDLGFEYDNLEEYADYTDADADADADVDVHYNIGLSDVDLDIYDQDPADDHLQPVSPPSAIEPWHNEPSDLDRSGSERGAWEESDPHEGEDDEDFEDNENDAVQQHQVPESGDDTDHLPPPDAESPPYSDLYDLSDGHGHGHRDEDSIIEHSLVSIEDDDEVDDDDLSDSSRTASLPPDGVGEGPTPSPSPPVSSQQYESGSNPGSGSGSGSDLITISDDSDLGTASAPGTASQQSADSASGSASASASAFVSASASSSSSSTSQGSRLGPGGPHRRQPLGRPSALGFDFNHNARASPRRSSLTPVIHPNRRLPRQSPEFPSHQNARPVPADVSDSSADELLAPPPRRRPGIERTRRPIFTIAPPSPFDEDDNDDRSDIEEPFPDPSDSLDDEPIIQERPRRNIDRTRPIQRDLSFEEDSDLSQGGRFRRSSLSRSGEEEDDNLSPSDLDEDFVSNHSSESGRSRAAGPAEGHHQLDGVYEDEEDDIVLQDRQADQSGRADNWYVWEASADEDDDEEEISLLARPQQRREERLSRQQQQEAVAERRRRAARNPFLEDSDLEPSDVDMDGDDELVEVVFDRQLNGPPAPPLQRQPRNQQRQRSHRPHHRGQAVEFIDLTEEPDSPGPHQPPLNNNRAAQNHNYIDLQQDHRPQQRPRHHRRMPPNGRPPPLARSDGSILGHRGPAVIDLTNDEPDFAAAVLDEEEDDDDDDLFVGQDFDDFLEHIPADRRLPAPVPAPLRNRRRSVELIGFAARNFNGALREIGGRYFPGLLAAIPGIPRGIANEIAIIGREQGLAMDPNPLADNPPDFNYQANGFGARPPPAKPEFDAPPPARPGFTRNTGVDPDTGEELEIVCASCDNELKYDDDEDDGPRPAKRPRNKKDREEHHFWAVKACGHVSPFLVSLFSTST